MRLSAAQWCNLMENGDCFFCICATIKKRQRRWRRHGPPCVPNTVKIYLRASVGPFWGRITHLKKKMGRSIMLHYGTITSRNGPALTTEKRWVMLCTQAGGRRALSWPPVRPSLMRWLVDLSRTPCSSFHWFCNKYKSFSPPWDLPFIIKPWLKRWLGLDFY